MYQILVHVYRDTYRILKKTKNKKQKKKNLLYRLQ